MTNFNFAKKKKKRFFWPLKVGSNLKFSSSNKAHDFHSRTEVNSIEQLKGCVE